MSTDEVKKLIVDGDIFMQDKDGEISKIAEIQNFESVQENNQDDAADAVRYAIEKEKSKSVSITITRESSIHLQKMLGIERISRKRFIKLISGLIKLIKLIIVVFPEPVLPTKAILCPGSIVKLTSFKIQFSPS